MSDLDVSKLKVTELRTELSNRNLSTKGKKEELATRLTEAIAAEAQETADPSEQDKTTENTADNREDLVDYTTDDLTETKYTSDVEEEQKEVEVPAEATATESKVDPTPQETTKDSNSPSPQVEKPKAESVVDEVGTKRKRSVETIEEDKRIKVEKEDGDITSSALYVKGFIRPLIIRHVQELFSKYGTVKRFWMDSIKTHSYVIYENESEAKKAYKNLNGIKFPADTGKLLSVGGLTPEQTEKLIEYEQNAAEKRLKINWEEAIEKVKAGEDLPSTSNDGGRKNRSIGLNELNKQLAQAAEPSHAPLREVKIERVQKRKELSLDDLFRKTTTLPHLYYLPNTDEDAKARLEKLQKA